MLEFDETRCDGDGAVEMFGRQFPVRHTCAEIVAGDLGPDEINVRIRRDRTGEVYRQLHVARQIRDRSQRLGACLRPADVVEQQEKVPYLPGAGQLKIQSRRHLQMRERKRSVRNLQCPDVAGHIHRLQMRRVEKDGAREILNGRASRPEQAASLRQLDHSFPVCFARQIRSPAD